MKRSSSVFKVLFGFLMNIMALSLHAQALFNVAFVGDYLTVHTTPSNHAYPDVGIKILDDSFWFSDLDAGVMLMNNGFYKFAASENQGTMFQLSKSQSAPSSIGLLLALNARGGRPLSVEKFTVSNQDPGRIIGYVYGWITPPVASDIAAAGYTHVILTFGLFSTTSPGVINIEALSGIPDVGAYVTSLHQAGLKVLLAIGGVSSNIPNTTVDFNHAVSLAANPGAFQTAMLSSLADLSSTYGFDGYDFDIEFGLNAANSFTNPSLGCDPSNFDSACDISYLASIINSYHEAHSAQLLTLVPQIANIAATANFSEIWGNYASLVMQTYQSLEWVAFQNYNAGCAYGIDLICYPFGNNTLTSTSDPAVAFATDLLADWPPKTASGQITNFQPYTSFLKPSQVVIGYAVDDGSGHGDGYPTAITAITQDAIQCLRSQQYCDTYTPPVMYPGIGGVFAWTINFDATNHYKFATSLYPCVVQGNCTKTKQSP